MARVTAIGSVSALALALGSGSALADVTASGIWADWKEMIAAAGATLSVGSETAKGDTLALQQVAIGLDIPDAEVATTITATIPKITLTDRGDGSVGVTMAPESTILVTVRPEDDVPGDITLSVVQAGLELVIRGEGDAMTYDYAAETVLASLTDLIVGGEKMPADLRLGLIGAAGRYSMSGPVETREVASEFAADRLNLVLEASNPETREKVGFSLDMADIETTSAGVFAGLVAAADPAAALAAGMSVESELSYGATDFAFDFAAAQDNVTGKGRLEGGAFEAGLSAEGLSYATSSRGLELSVSGSLLPVPEIILGLAEGAFRLTMPIARGKTPQDVALLMRYRGLTAGESLWAMVDPTGILPRDPLTLVVDLTGKARWLVDILDPGATADMASPPGELTELALNELELAGVGAALTGSGAFTFDNTDLVTFEGMPRPTGSIDLRLVGGNGLIDRLTQMGLITTEDAFGARMMIGMIARPGDGADTLVSKIEVTPEGAILANGQPLPFP